MVLAITSIVIFHIVDILVELDLYLVIVYYSVVVIRFLVLITTLHLRLLRRVTLGHVLHLFLKLLVVLVLGR